MTAPLPAAGGVQVNVDVDLSDADRCVCPGAQAPLMAWEPAELVSVDTSEPPLAVAEKAVPSAACVALNGAMMKPLYVAPLPALDDRRTWYDCPADHVVTGLPPCSNVIVRGAVPPWNAVVWGERGLSVHDRYPMLSPAAATAHAAAISRRRRRRSMFVSGRGCGT